MVKSIGLAIFFLFMAQEPVLKKSKLTEYLNMSVATELRNMSQQELSAKFLGARIPDIALTDEQSAIEFTVTASPTFWLEKDVALLKEFYDSSIPNLFQKIDFSKKDLIEVNGKKYAAYEFVGTPASENAGRSPEQRYTYLLYTLHRNGLVTISFSCPPYLKAKWQPTVEKMYQTIKFQ